MHSGHLLSRDLHPDAETSNREAGRVRQSWWRTHPEDLSMPPMMTAGPLYYTNSYAEGDFVEAAGLSFKVLHPPGHTPGSTVLLIPEERVLLLGDACNGFTFLFDASCPSVAQYREMLLTLQAETAGNRERATSRETAPRRI